MPQPKDILKKSRKAKGFTQTEMANKIARGTNKTYSLRQYQRLEKGLFPKYNSDAVKEIDRILGIDLHSKIYESQNGQSSSEILGQLRIQTELLKEIALKNGVGVQRIKNIVNNH
jgi:ribosome-binding protein aMBF1 (putative translation factor)